ncbi:hypothetical protein C2845_PM09G01520 [Panicum miliaceum]|uniref:Uncharacterized protein n=1 Tax=Panicum miliaceum TaxID=4540 RepID=A0A3L6S377_PANMI|nr:hypothetical protein C2845_PM09G01520 [Panicum miliaceum]
MASSKSVASPVLVFFTMTLMLVAFAQAQTPAPAPSQGSCPPGFKSYLDLTDFLRSAGRETITFLDASLVPLLRSIISLVPHTGLKLCVCFKTSVTSSFPIECVSY